MIEPGGADRQNKKVDKHRQDNHGGPMYCEEGRNGYALKITNGPVIHNAPADPPGQLQTNFKTGLTPGRLSSRLLALARR